MSDFEEYDDEGGEEESNPCPECNAPLIEKWSGVECSNKECGYWFCA